MYLEVIEQDKKVWVPPWLEQETPGDGEQEPGDELGDVNTVQWDEGKYRQVEKATEEELEEEIAEYGWVAEPEIFRTLESEGEISTQNYATQHWTHFDFRADVRRLINRVQAKFPWRTFVNTYYRHPPVYDRAYEFVSVDFWGGGLNSRGHYVGYRGKPIGTRLGTAVMRAAYYDRYLPNIYWIIWNGRMWTRGYGWGPAPYGPPDSDPGHYQHVHITYHI